MQKTFELLGRAFVGECQARNRYTFYASAAKKEGYELVAAVFAETADQEKQHAKTFYTFLKELMEKPENGELVLPDLGVAIALGTTVENLRGSVAGENEEATQMYQELARVATEEGYPQIAARVKAIAEAEAYHRDRYSKLLEHLEAGEMFEQVDETTWVCRECGYRFVGKQPPVKCPSCEHPQAFFQRETEALVGAVNN